MPQADSDVPDSSPELDTYDTGLDNASSPPTGSDPPEQPVSADAGTEAGKSVSPLDAFITKLTTAPREPQATPEAKLPETKTVEPEAKAPEPHVQDAFEGLPREKLKAATQERINSLWSRGKELEKQAQEAAPYLEHGKAFHGLIQEHALGGDLAHVEDAQVAGAIKFQAALNRLTQGRGTQADRQMTESVFSNFDATRAQLGYAAPQADHTELETALKSAAEAYQIDPEVATSLLALLAKSKPRTAQPQAPVAAPPQQQYREEAQANSRDATDLTLYESQLANDLTAAGVRDLPTHVQKNLMPAVLATIAKLVPGRNPAEVYATLRPDAQYARVKAAQAQYVAKQAGRTPAPAVKAPAIRPLNGGGANAAWSRNDPGTLQSAIEYMTGQKP